MSKIKFRLENWGKTVLFQVIEMDERFRAERDKKNIFHSECGLVVGSFDAPGFDFDDNNLLYLRGYLKKCDDNVCVKIFYCEKDAKDYCLKIICALRDWAENWEGWEENEADTKEPRENVYEF